MPEDRRRFSSTSSFDIRVAVLGYVSAGKSTVLNALLQGKYTEVAMRRTMAGVNSFRNVSSNEANSSSSSNHHRSTVDHHNRQREGPYYYY